MLIAVLLAWALVADPIVYVVGAGPLGVVSAARVLRALADGTGHWTQRVAAAWFGAALGAASVAATVLAWAAWRSCTWPACSWSAGRWPGSPAGSTA